MDGVPRRYCEGTSCQKDHTASKWTDYYGRLKSKTPLAGLDEEMIGGCTIVQGRDYPLSRSWTARWAVDGWRLDGNCDFNPKMFMAEDGSQPEWLVTFLAEFGSAGADPGMSRGRGMDYTLDMENNPKTWWTKA